MTKILMVVPDRMVMGGIASVVNGYREYGIGDEYEITYVESYVNGSKFDKLKIALKAYRKFRKALKASDYDLVHIHSSFGPSFYRKMPFINMAYKRNIPIVNHIHGAEFENFYPQASNSKKKLIRKIYGKCRRIVVLSDEWKEKISEIVPKDRIDIVENYCIIPEGESEGNGKKILFLGEIGQRKGCYDIPDIIRRTEDTLSEDRNPEDKENRTSVDAEDNGLSAGGEDNKLTVVLGGNGDTAPVSLKIEEFGLKSSFEFPGWVRGSDKEKLLRDSGIFLFPSYNEGMPMSVLEAMAYGLLVITTNVGGIPKLISHGETGFIFEPGNTKAMAECLSKLLNDEELRRRIGQQAREFVIKNYSFEKHLEKLKAVYSKVISKK
ncbi:MAG: glycosyltransferase family 4 protein [Lachnospiraceae bacterium]|nr:glycosyltransferase family 4 protein [Lachnospiraceae bacterium]